MAIIPKDVVDNDETGYFFITQEEITSTESGVLDMEQEMLELMFLHPDKSFGAVYEPLERRYKFYWFTNP